VWLKGLPLEYVYGDLFDRDALQRAVTGVDYVFHSAGVTKARTAEEYFRGNTEGVKNMLDAVSEHNPGVKRFVQISSQTAAGPSPGITPITEETSPHPITTYGRSKLKAEQACAERQGAIPITIVRPPAVYGPRDKDIYEFFNTMSKGLQPMVGFKEKFVSLIHVGDLVRGVLGAAESEKARGQTYFISSSKVYGWKEVGEVTRSAIGKAAFRIKIPEAGVFAIAGISEFFGLFSTKPVLINIEKARDMVQDYWTCDSSKAQRDFGYTQEIPLEEGIRNTVEWYRSKGWL
jgi:nucleoside-diphosphate-sugar epimerase